MKRSTLLVALACVSSLAFASMPWIDLEKRFTPEQLHATGLDTLSATQLATLNRLLRNESEAASRQVATPQDDKAERLRFVGFDDAPIVSTLVGTLSGWEPGTEFQLANGQRWKVLKGHYKIGRPLEAPQVKIVPGVAGRWFFRIDDDAPGARVYRID
jgi:hypothetical protein